MSAGYSLQHDRRRGRPPLCRPEVVVLIVEMRREGLSYGAISIVLNREGVLTPAGRPIWRKSAVDRLLHTHYAMEMLDGIDYSP